MSRLTRGRDLDVVDRWESTGRRAQVVRPTQTKNDFLLAYRGVAIGDDVAIDKGKKTGRVAQMLRKGIVCVSIEGGGSKSVDAQRIHIKTPAEPLDLTNVMQEPPAALMTE